MSTVTETFAVTAIAILNGIQDKYKTEVGLENEDVLRLKARAGFKVALEFISQQPIKDSHKMLERAVLDTWALCGKDLGSLAEEALEHIRAQGRPRPPLILDLLPREEVLEEVGAEDRSGC